MQTTVLVIATILTAAFSQLIFKSVTLKSIGYLDFSLTKIIYLFGKIITNPAMLAGIFLYGLSFVLWLFVISRMKMGVIYPLAASSIVAVVVIGSLILYKETLSPIQIIGILTIIIGVFLLLYF